MRKYLVIFYSIVFLLMICACSSENKLDQGLKSTLKTHSGTQEFMLVELTDFDWEKVYFIPPYMSKEKIEEAIGIKSDDIQDNNSDEIVLYIIFTNGNQIVCQIYGRTENLGFDFEVGTYNDYLKLDKEDSKFCINTVDGEKVYTLME